MLREAKRRRRFEQKQSLALEKKVRARAREQAASDRRLAAAPIEPPPVRRSEYAAWLDQRDEPRVLSSAKPRSQNDELAAEMVAAGGGIQELIEVTGLRTRRNVYEALDPQIVDRALSNDRRRPKEQPLLAGTGASHPMMR
jgi:hypothetical protein